MSLAALVERARPAFWADAACLTRDAQRLIADGKANFFPERHRSAGRARDICADCPVRLDCLAFAMESPFLRGIWGGTSEADRKRMRSA